jgi:EmrB/QacA subfamily drug resistance transporter
MDGGIAWGTPRARGVLAATILASGVAFLDGTIVNVALPTIGRSLGVGLAGLQWTLDAYLLALTAFLLPAGALADRVGRRRVFLVGLAAFAGSSALCALAWDAASLAAARAVQGLAGALLVPGSLAVLRASFREADVPRAVGAWAGLAGVATAIGPFAGGWLAQAVSWRAIFLVNAPLAAAAFVAAHRCVPESRDPERRGADLLGGALAAAGLGGVVFALIERGTAPAPRAVAAAGGIAALAAFLAVEARRRDPMLPLGLFGDRAFAALNAVTLAVYFALGGAAFLFVVQLQVGAGWSPLAAGAAMGPVTLLILVLSPLAARAAGRVGARPLLVAGALACAAGLALLGRVGPGTRFAPDVLPGVAMLGLGLGLAVAPLTSAVLAAAPPARAGIASAVNNAVARLAGLLAVAALPAAGGLSPGETLAGGLGGGYRRAMALAAAVAALGAGLAAAGLPRAARGQKTSAKPPGAGTISTALRPRSDVTR